jgi:phage gp46-like protein
VRWGWWGDGLDGQTNDQIGSRLWLLSRAKVTQQTVIRAREYAEEALQWLVDDGVATRVTVTAERMGLDGLALACVIERDQRARVELRFDNTWRTINV